MIVIQNKVGDLRKAFAETDDSYIGYASGNANTVYAYAKDTWSEVEVEPIVDLSAS